MTISSLERQELEGGQELENAPHNSRIPPRRRGDGLDSAQAATDEYVYIADGYNLIRRIIFIMTVCSSMFTNQLGLCNSLTTLEIIGDSFDVSDPGKLSWIISGYGLTLGTFVLIGGRLGDEFGNKAIFIIGMGWLALTSMMAGVSVYSSYPVYVLARVLQGLGPALTVPNALAIMGKCFSEGPRNMGFAWFAASAPVGAMAGLLFGPLFAMAWWPWIYWSQALGVAFLVIIAIFAIPNMPVESEQKQRRTIRETLDHLDLLGGASGVIALVLFNFAWNQSLVTTWDEPYVYVCLILSLLFLAAFSYIELRLARYPILPVAVLTSDIAFVFGCTAAGWSTFGIWLFYVLRISLNIGGQTPIQLAAWLSPILVTGISTALIVGKVINKVPASFIMLFAMLCYFLTSLLMALRPVHSTYWTYFFFATIIATFAMDSSLPAATIIFANAVPRQYQGMGSSVIMTIVVYSISLGLGFAGTIELQINNGGHTEADLLHGYRGTLWFSVGLTALGTVLALVFLLKDHRRRKLAKNQNEEEKANSTET
ncbi:MFS general substrate transporter [Penicillium manginii]|uniref:MFS general substrate transporter n=1 Tax=Penicillium manginii TaxID=203109 RepID=UPI0025473AD5|nr:MFS general substrate transporter [Penicillium manginii]KAJ5744145.1 MFS general substrate transporter [Penicillium manginii]